MLYENYHLTLHTTFWKGLKSSVLSVFQYFFFPHVILREAAHWTKWCPAPPLWT